MRSKPPASMNKIPPKRPGGGRLQCRPENRCGQSPRKRRHKLSDTISAFDAIASAYDTQFTATTLGAAMRRAVWARCAVRFASGSRVLEMNCGTGEDALWLAHRGVKVLATDVSAAMLQVAENKLAASPRKASARFHRLAWEELDTFEEGP